MLKFAVAALTFAGLLVAASFLALFAAESLLGTADSALQREAFDAAEVLSGLAKALSRTGTVLNWIGSALLVLAAVLLVLGRKSWKQTVGPDSVRGALDGVLDALGRLESATVKQDADLLEREEQVQTLRERISQAQTALNTALPISDRNFKYMLYGIGFTAVVALAQTFISLLLE